MRNVTIDVNFGSPYHVWLLKEGMKGQHVGWGIFVFTMPVEVHEEMLQTVR